MCIHENISFLSLLNLQKNVCTFHTTTKYKGQTQIRICTYIRNWLNLNMKRNQSNIHKNMRVEFDPLQWILSSCVRAAFPVAGNPLLQRMFFWVYFNSCLGCVLLSSPADGWIRLHSHHGPLPSFVPGPGYVSWCHNGGGNVDRIANMWAMFDNIWRWDPSLLFKKAPPSIHQDFFENGY